MPFWMDRRGSEPQLVQFLGVEDNPAANFTLKCPDGYKAIGYIASPYQYGIDFFDVCPPVTLSCTQ